MVCANCSNWLQPSDAFCPKCGRSTSTEPVTPRPRPLQKQPKGVSLRKTISSISARFGYLIPIVGGLAVLAYGISYYVSPLTRLNLNGVHLRYHPETRGGCNYLIGTHSETKSWAYRDGQMQTPLAGSALDETGTVAIETDPSPRPETTLHVKAEEWIKMFHKGDTMVNQTIPSGHPSLASADIVIDRQGSLLNRSNTSSTRVGKAAYFLFPSLPKGTQRPGTTWTDHVSWVDTIGEWQIGWDATLGWKIKDFEPCYEGTCAKLIYETELVPRIVQAPGWAAKVAKGVSYEGSGKGEALYDLQEKLLLSNSLNYTGRLTIEMSSLESVPEEQQVGATTTNDPGAIVIQFANKFDTRKPT